MWTQIGILIWVLSTQGCRLARVISHVINQAILRGLFFETFFKVLDSSNKQIRNLGVKCHHNKYIRLEAGDAKAAHAR